MSALARQGVLTDLWPYIDGDPELGREAVMSHVLECAETDGKLYRVFSNFRIDTLVASAEAAGDRTSWTLEEMLAAYGGAMPEVYDSTPASNPFLFGIDADGLLYDLLRMDLDRYVDWSTGECFFDTEGFRNALRLCGGMKRENAGGTASTALWEGQAVVYQRTLGSIGDLTLDDAIFGGPEALMDYEAMMAENGVAAYKTKVDGEWVGVVDDLLGDAERARETGLLYGGAPVAADLVTGAVEKSGYAAYIGFPTEGGSGSSFRVSDCLAITEACENKEGAWQFVRGLLLPGGSLANTAANLAVTYDAFPVNRTDFEQFLEPRYLTDDAGEYVLDREGERIEQAVSTFGLGEPIAMLVFLRSPTQEQMERFYALYRSIDHAADADYALMDLIREQAQPYFAGDKSLEESARLIQNRASLYVNENR